MEHIWSLVCQLSIVSQQTNNVSLYEVIERIGFMTDVVDVPGIATQLEIVTTWIRSDLEKPEQAQGRVLLKSPDGKTITDFGPGLYEIDLREKQRLRASAKLLGVPYRGDGVYRFVVQFKTANRWKDAASIPLEIVKLSNAPDRISAE